MSTVSGFMKCRLTRLRSTNANMRTEVAEGECFGPPEEGRSFSMWNDKPLDTSTGANARMIETSLVQKVRPSKVGGLVNFLTENSEYIFEVIG
jgi:hypothetical protein